MYHLMLSRGDFWYLCIYMCVSENSHSQCLISLTVFLILPDTYSINLIIVRSTDLIRLQAIFHYCIRPAELFEICVYCIEHVGYYLHHI